MLLGLLCCSQTDGGVDWTAKRPCRSGSSSEGTLRASEGLILVDKLLLLLTPRQKHVALTHGG